jgi:hypothetical protein
LKNLIWIGKSRVEIDCLARVLQMVDSALMKNQLSRWLVSLEHLFGCKSKVRSVVQFNRNTDNDVDPFTEVELIKELKMLDSGKMCRNVERCDTSFEFCNARPIRRAVALSCAPPPRRRHAAIKCTFKDDKVEDVKNSRPIKSHMGLV